jgi:hypothetical protein
VWIIFWSSKIKLNNFLQITQIDVGYLYFLSIPAWEKGSNH